MNIKTMLRWIVLFTLLLALVVPLAGVSAGAGGPTEVHFTGKEYLVESLEPPPVITFPGGNFHGRNSRSLTYEESDNICIQGPGYVTANININKQGKEHIWGDFVIEPEAYAGQGSWVTKWHNDGDVLVIIGHGTGIFAGMTIKAIYSDGPDYMPFAGTIHVPPYVEVQCGD